MSKLTGGEAVVAALDAHGVNVVFGIPGTHNLPIYVALAKYGVRHVVTRHEQGAGFAADGWARTTGRPGVCLTTTGPAVLNAATAMAQAYSDSIPVLLVSPGLPLNHPAAGNGYLHEVKNQTAAMNAIVSYSHRVGSVEEIPAVVANAFAAMTSGRPRPVHVEIPLDLLDQVAAVDLVDPIVLGPRVPAPSEVARAVTALTSAERPVIVAGGGSRGAEVQALAERLGAPVVTTANGKGVVRGDHPLTVGSGLHHVAVSNLVRDSDLVLAIGTELAPSDLWAGPLDGPGTLIRIDIDAVTPNANPDVNIVADADLAVRMLLEQLPELSDGQDRAAGARRLFGENAQAEGAAYAGLTAALGRVLGEDGVLAGDSTMACYYGALGNVPAYRPGAFLFPTGLGTLGYGLPAAIGAKVARPQQSVVVVHGDGGIMFSVAELATAAQLSLALPVVVVDNGGYGEIRNEMADRGDPVQAVDLPSPDFAALARSLGCYGVRVDDSSGLEETLNTALEADRPTLVHLPEEVAR
ncbi:thiamine pyrophosphate-binding protein [Kribbella sp. NBC_00889]|uniref:thiamine pyrophosphate-binding protein n=1 Tax=Kribbella sp. NBC_00889 TaxID=2975974 RepID=UPI00386F2ED4|nr:5-guanidino-2-oxopentanoate decarboxylase [Kribbella sp. NBC_00889]